VRKVLARLARWAAFLMLALAPAGLAMADPPPSGQTQTDEFAARSSPTVALASVVRINRHPLGSDPGQWHATAAGVVVAPGVVVTLRTLTNGLTSDEDLQVIGQDHMAYPATINTAASDDDIVVLNAPTLRTAPLVLSDTPVADHAPVVAAGYSMTVDTQNAGEVRNWTVTPSLLNGQASVSDSITHNMQTGYGYGGGALLDDCGRMAGVLSESLEEQGEPQRTAVGLDRLQALLNSAGVHPTVRPGWCAPQDLVTRVRAARTQLIDAERSAANSYAGLRGVTQLQGQLGRTIGIGLGGIAALVGALGAAITGLRQGDPARPRRKPGMVLFFVGLIVLGAGFAIDPLTGAHSATQMVQLSCTLDEAASSRGARVDRPVNVSFDPEARCRAGTVPGGDLHYALGVSDPSSSAPVFVRTIRPAGASRQMGPGRPAIVETHVFSTDLSHYDIRRYALPSQLFPSVQRVFTAHNTEQTCNTPQVSDDSQADRRRLVLPYAVAQPEDMISHTAFRCQRVTAPPAGH
jgi:hypothetical protein